MSSAMIMRRAAMLAGFENWEDITESSVGALHGEKASVFHGHLRMMV